MPIIKRNLIFNIVILLIERVFQLVLSIACVSLMAKYLNMDDNGKFAYIFSLSTVFITLSFFTGSELLHARLSKYHYLQKHIITNAFYLRNLFGLMCLLVSIIFSFTYIQNIEMRITFLLCVIGPVVGESFYVFGCWFTAMRRNAWFSLCRTLGLLGRFSTIWYLIEQHTSHLHYFAYAYIIEAFFISSSVVILYILYPHTPTWGKFNKVLFLSLARDGALIGIGLILFYTLLRIDRILLERMLDHNTLALYATIVQLSDAWFNIGIMVCTLLGPYFIFSAKNKVIALYRLKLMMAYMVAASIIICACIYYNSAWLIQNLLGNKYIQGTSLLFGSCSIGVLVFINQLCTLWSMYTKAYIFQIIVYILGICAVITFGHYFVPIYHLYGMLLALACAYVLMIGIQIIYHSYCMRKL
jgi:O-antigen/teichoic acid export membrane protein